MKRRKDLPYFHIILGIGAIIVGLIYFAEWAFVPKPKVDPNECQFHFVDVGQGDCAMIISGRDVVVIDTGPQDHAKSTVEYISEYTDTIEYLILTHPHEDHIGAADELLEAINVENVILSDASIDTTSFDKLLDAIDKSGANVIEARAGDDYSAGGIDFTILSPIDEFVNLNDYSIVTKVEYGDVSAIITGDVEHNSEKEIVRYYGEYRLKADILEVSHHGSQTSNHEDFIDAISPNYAVIQCAKDNPYGHPHKETIDALEDREITYYRTYEDGHVVFVSDGEKVSKKP